MGATSAKDVWGTLKEEFQGSGKVRVIKLQTLRHEFELIKMKESQTRKDNYTKIKELVSQMRSYGDNILDKRIVEKILISIPRKYNAIVTTIEQTNDLSTLSVTELIASLEAYEQRLSRHDDNTVENVFQSKLKLRSHDKRYGGKKNGRENSRNEGNSRNFSKENQDEYPSCGICKRTNHVEKYCRWHRKEQCRYCKKFGHEEKNCYNKNKHQANFVEEHEGENDQHDYEQHLFYATQDSKDELSRNWYFDSGCSNYMARDESIFKDIDDSVKVKVRLGNAVVVKSKGKDTAIVETKKGTRFIKDVLLVPNLKENLLSIGQMMKKGYTLHFEGDTCSIYDNSHKRHGIVKVKMEKRNRSFPINFKYTSIPQSDMEDMEKQQKKQVRHLHLLNKKFLHQNLLQQE
ncbi:ARM REPEAT PROTEIN INTERACTING WITH ABF2 [Trifolium repens]|nr:ARM REPEAT PROTEIN INTERACTING WITH ABF2 [Trifolium repens]